MMLSTNRLAASRYCAAHMLRAYRAFCTRLVAIVGKITCTPHLLLHCARAALVRSLFHICTVRFYLPAWTVGRLRLARTPHAHHTTHTHALHTYTASFAHSAGAALRTGYADYAGPLDGINSKRGIA